MTHAHSVRIGSFLAVAGLALGMGVTHAADQKEQGGAGRAITVTGRIVSVRPAEGQLTVRTMEGKELELNLDQGSQVKFHRQPATLSQFKEGTRVRVTYEPAGGRNRVLSLRGAPVTAQEVQQELHNTMEAVKNYTYQQKQEYQKRLEPVLQDLDERIDHLKEQAKAASKESQKWYEHTLSELRQERRVLHEKLAGIQAAAPGAWDEIKAGVGAAWNDLSKAFQRANQRLQEGNPPNQP